MVERSNARRLFDEAYECLCYSVGEWLDLIEEVAASGVEFDYPGRRYVTVQIGRETWDRIRELATPPQGEGENEVGPTAHDHGGSEPSPLSDGGANPPSPGGSL